MDPEAEQPLIGPSPMQDANVPGPDEPKRRRTIPHGPIWHIALMLLSLSVLLIISIAITMGVVASLTINIFLGYVLVEATRSLITPGSIKTSLDRQRLVLYGQIGLAGGLIQAAALIVVFVVVIVFVALRSSSDLAESDVDAEVEIVGGVAGRTALRERLRKRRATFREKVIAAGKKDVLSLPVLVQSLIDWIAVVLASSLGLATVRYLKGEPVWDEAGAVVTYCDVILVVAVGHLPKTVLSQGCKRLWSSLYGSKPSSSGVTQIDNEQSEVHPLLRHDTKDGRIQSSTF